MWLACESLRESYIQQGPPIFDYQPAKATRFPSHGSGQPALELQIVTKLSSVAFELTAVLRPLVHESVALTIWPHALYKCYVCWLQYCTSVHCATYDIVILVQVSLLT